MVTSLERRLAQACTHQPASPRSGRSGPLVGRQSGRKRGGGHSSLQDSIFSTKTGPLWFDSLSIINNIE